MICGSATVLDEVKLRKPEFVEGVLIPLADGQAWHFPRPAIELFCPRFRGGKVSMGTATNFGPEFDALVEDVLASEGWAPQLMALWAVATALLRRNYLLSDADLSALFAYRPGDEPEAVMNQVWDVATGNGPKASAVGSP